MILIYWCLHDFQQCFIMCRGNSFHRCTNPSLIASCLSNSCAVTYTFINQTQYGIFSINSATGSLTVSNSINFETMPTFMTVFYEIRDDGTAPGNVPGTTLSTITSVTVKVAVM